MGSISHLFAILLSSLATCASPLPGSGLLGGVSSTLSPVTGTVTNVVSGSSAQPGVINALTPVTNTLGSGPVGVVVGSVPALLESQCDSAFSKCNVTVSGKIENMLTDGGDFTGRASVAGWVRDGHAYGKVELAGFAPLPFNINCDTTSNVCLGTLSGNATQVFANGKDVALWGWLTPTGHCDNGTCYGSITALGDPAY